MLLLLYRALFLMYLEYGHLHYMHGQSDLHISEEYNMFFSIRVLHDQMS